MSEAPQPKPDDEKQPDKPPKRRSKRWMLVVLALFLLAGGAYGVHYYLVSRHFQGTDDAQVEGDVVQVSSQVTGQVVALHVTDNEPVKAGQLLVEIDSRDYRTKLDQALKNVESARRRLDQARENESLVSKQAAANLSQGQTGVTSAQAAVATAQRTTEASRRQVTEAEESIREARANLRRSRTDVASAVTDVGRLDADVLRYRQLYNKDEVSGQQLEQVETNDEQARAKMEGARQAEQAALAQVGIAQARAQTAQENVAANQSREAEASRKVGEAQAKEQGTEVGPEQVAVALSQVKTARAEMDQAQAAVKLARIDLERCRIYAPVSGRIGKRTVEKGTYLSVGTPVLAVVIDRNLWITANFKETQLERMQVGQPVDIDVDTYPHYVFKAHVDSFQPGTGARFSLLPPENAAGSFVKVVQRIPVKIVLDHPPPKDKPLFPGMSVYASVRVR